MRAQDYPASIGSNHSSSGQLLAGDRQQIDTLRGFACLLIVLFHTTIEVRVHDSGSLQGIVIFNEFVKDVRIPLFTFLSGYIYAYRPLTGDDRFGYLRRKARRLLMPMLFVALVTAVAKSVMSENMGSQSVALSVVEEIVRPSLQLWFVEALFLIFVGLSVGIYRYVFSVWLLLASLAIALAIGWLGLSHIRDFSVIPALELFPYFLAGALVWSLRIPKTHVAIGVATLTLLAIGLWRTLVIADIVNPIRYLTPLAALLAISLLGPKVRALSWLGRYSMGIFLYHGLVLAAFAPRLPGSPAIALLQLMVLAIALPTLFETFVARKIPALLPLTLGRTKPPSIPLASVKPA